MTSTRTTKAGYSILLLLTIFIFEQKHFSCTALHRPTTIIPQNSKHRRSRHHRGLSLSSPSREEREWGIENDTNIENNNMTSSSSSSLRQRKTSSKNTDHNDNTLQKIRGGDTISSTTVTTTAAVIAAEIDQKKEYTPSKLRNAVFPIYEKEVKKFLLMGAIKFFVIMALTLTRDTKDTLVVTQCGAEAIAFLKIYGVLPAATAFIALYSKMTSVFEKKSLFYITCVPFFVFFLLFDVFLYPNKNIIQPTVETVQKLIGGSNGGAMDIVSKIISNWTSAIYFVVAELYSSVSVGILFWQFANDVVTVDEAKRFYPLFSQMGGLAPIVAGQYIARFASQASDFNSSMHRLTVAVTFAGVMICVFYHLSTSFIDREQFNSSSSKDETAKAPKKKKKSKMSMTDSFKFLVSSQYLRLVFMLVLGYGLSVNFTEIMWKSLLKKKYPDPLEYQRFIGNFSSAVGVATCVVILFGVHVIRILGWRVGAMTTPALMAVLAIPFFICIFMGIDNPERLSIAVALGTAQSLLSKTSKYALFDPTTQMAYIPLDEESKVKGKAAIDVLGSRLGKSGGSLIQQGLVLLFGNILNASAAVAVVFYSVLVSWLLAANKLSGLFIAKTEMQKADRQGEGKK